MIAPLILRTAILSECKTYRYTLTRAWDQSLPYFAWVMLNPSTADDLKDDATIRRCIGFTKSWGGGGIRVVNLFAYRTTRPSALWTARLRGIDIVGPRNDHYIIDALDYCDRVILAWGGNATDYKCRVKAVLKIIQESNRLPECLIKTVSGQPGHPVRLPGNLTPREYKTP